MTHDDVDEAPDPGNDPEGYADHLFDIVSGTLRDRPTPGPWASPSSRATKDELVRCLERAHAEYLDLRRALVESDARFDELHAWIMDGGPLPSPWRRHHVLVPKVTDEP